MTSTNQQGSSGKNDLKASESSESREWNPPPVDRDWVAKLLEKHADDPRLEKHRQLCKKYPILQKKALILAPMVDQSDLPYRLLCRKYGTNLCFTPMIHAKMFQERPIYRKKFWDTVNGTPKEDRPLIVQLCGSDRPSLLYTIKTIIESPGSVDGIDLNCGCPQSIAKRGQYGAFLLEKENGNVIVELVKYLVKEVGDLIPISVKVRILPSGVEESLKLYERIVGAGAHMLTIHGRTRLQKGTNTAHADWCAIKKVVDLLGHRIPIMANGSIGNLDDVRGCLEQTGVDGIMSSEAILEYPPIFNETGTKATDGKRVGPSRVQVAREYLALDEKYPNDKGGQGSGFKCVRAHFHRFFHADLKGRNDTRRDICHSNDYEPLRKACDAIDAVQKAEGHMVENEALSWYMRYRGDLKKSVLPNKKRKSNEIE